MAEEKGKIKTFTFELVVPGYFTVQRFTVPAEEEKLAYEAVIVELLNVPGIVMED
jgi:hypothetical protein